MNQFNKMPVFLEPNISQGAKELGTNITERVKNLAENIGEKLQDLVK